MKRNFKSKSFNRGSSKSYRSNSRDNYHRSGKSSEKNSYNYQQTEKSDKNYQRFNKPSLDKESQSRERLINSDFKSSRENERGQYRNQNSRNRSGRHHNQNNYGRNYGKNNERARKPQFTPEVVHEMLFITKPKVSRERKPYTLDPNDPLADIDEFIFDETTEEGSETHASISALTAEASETEEISQDFDDSVISVTPTLLDEYSSWKGKPLNEYSLIHLLTLALLYHNHFNSLLMSNQISQTTTLSTDAYTSKENQNWQGWIKEQINNKDFFINQEFSDGVFNLVFNQVQEVEKGHALAQKEISKYLIGWNWERLPLLRQLILLVAWVLIKRASSAQVKPLLNDAINHAKWFGDEQDGGFINSILDKLISEHKLWA